MMKKVLIMVAIMATVLMNGITTHAAERVIGYFEGEQKSVRIYENDRYGKYYPVDLYLPAELADALNEAWDEYNHMPSVDANFADRKFHYFENKYKLDILASKYELI